MIEIIYSEDTNEKEEKCTDIRLPRNVRQIGKGNENKKNSDIPPTLIRLAKIIISRDSISWQRCGSRAKLHQLLVSLQLWTSI